MNFPTQTIIIEVPATAGSETLRENVIAALRESGRFKDFEVSIESRPGEVYTVEVHGRRDGLYIFHRLQDRDLFAAVFKQGAVTTGAEPVFGPEAMGDLIAAEEED